MAIYKQRVWTRYNRETNPNSHRSRDSNLGLPDWVSGVLIIWPRNLLFFGVLCRVNTAGLLLGVGLTLSTSHMQWSVSYTYYVRVNFFCPYQRELNRQNRPSSLIYSYGAEKYLLFLVCKQPLLRETRCGAFLFI